MKSSIWMGLSFTVLAGIAQASEGLPRDQKVVVNTEDGNHVEIAVELTSLEDGSVLLQKEDGSSLIIPKSTVDKIKAMQITKKPKYEKSTPCVAASNSK